MPAWLDVFARFLRLGLTSFGGPLAHLGYFRREFVSRARYVDDAEFTEIVALCSILPGPTSSQVGMTLGLRRAGIAGACAAWLGFTLPSAFLLTTFGMLLRAGKSTGTLHARAPLVAGALDGLAGVAGAVVLVAIVALAKNLAHTRMTASIAGLCFASSLALGRVSPGLLWLPVVLGGALGGVFIRGVALPVSAPRTHVSHRSAVVAAVAFALLIAGLPIVAVPGTLLGLFALFFRAGGLVFGGGHVVLPFLTGLISSGVISARDFFAGYGAATAMPGPLFAFAAFAGAADRAQPPLAGALVATLGIFSPSFLLLCAVLPVWTKLRRLPRAGAVLAGCGAAVVGLLAATFVTPIGATLAHQPRSLIAGSLALPLLVFPPVPAWAAVAAGAAVGALLSGSFA